MGISVWNEQFWLGKEQNPDLHAPHNDICRCTSCPDFGCTNTTTHFIASVI
ncbi:hypothetical protein MTR_2g081270 [Medicago truncatula]|uniref:Uncharacterized protein n=1 Tax=Medicago truncatula TaxID=3880 RepID=G7IR78_MEDTR|nr:hypothetical protein MTR_2g081270 [Medicago truncatula]